MSESKQTASLHPNVRLLGWASFLNDVASEMIYPLMPQFLMSVLGGSRVHLGIIEGIGESTASLLKLWSGVVSDQVHGRKRFVVIGYLLAAVARPLIAFTVAPWQLFAARITDRTGKGVRTSPRDAMVADSTPENQHGRAFGYQRGMDNLGAAIGPLLAALFLWLRPNDFRLLFLMTIIPGSLLVGLVIFGLREIESRPVRQSATTDRAVRPGFWVYMVALTVFAMGKSTDAFLLVRASELGVPVFGLPLLWFAFHIVKSGGNLLAGRLVDRIGAKIPMLIGWCIYAATYFAFGFATSAWHAGWFFLGYGLYYAITEPAEKTLVTRLAGATHRGLAFGWFNFALGIASLPASVVFGYLYERFGPQAAFSFGGGMALIATLILLSNRITDDPMNLPS